ncbi:hypothetical protein RIF29_14837 [Crotalaria pallida]|uniref:Uncharacterized protein n=1 Tax=Crotalaria pallida TaxID=3830 RepID=A0AAN9ID35_CROPI
MRSALNITCYAFFDSEQPRPPHHSVRFLLEGYVKIQGIQEQVTSPAALLPSHGNLSFQNLAISGPVLLPQDGAVTTLFPLEGQLSILDHRVLLGSEMMIKSEGQILLLTVIVLIRVQAMDMQNCWQHELGFKASTSIRIYFQALSSA